MPVAAGASHSAAVGEDGTLFVWGSDSVTGMKLDPTRVAGLPAPVRQVAAGTRHTAIVTDDGKLLTFGDGREGRLGHSDEANLTTPTLVDIGHHGKAFMVACGGYHSALLTQMGGVYCFGHGGYGQLGLGNQLRQLAPMRVPAERFSDERIVMLAAGGYHTVALSDEGHVFTWGDSENGQLGHSDRERHCVPRQVEPEHFGGEKVVFVAAGEFHTVAVTAGGRLYTWGMGSFGQLGHGDAGDKLVPTLAGAETFGASAVMMAACGTMHTLVVTSDGALWACGCGNNGQLGLNDRANRLSFVRVGLGEFGGARIVAAAAGDYHSAATTEDGALWTWGTGASGQLGHGDAENRRVPTRVAQAGFGSGRIGRCLALPAEHALAFAMCTHGRLGAGAHCSGLAAEPGLVAMIAGASLEEHRRLLVGAARAEGVVRLVGGMLARELSVVGRP